MAWSSATVSKATVTSSVRALPIGRPRPLSSFTSTIRRTRGSACEHLDDGDPDALAREDGIGLVRERVEAVEAECGVEDVAAERGRERERERLAERVDGLDAREVELPLGVGRKDEVAAEVDAREDRLAGDRPAEQAPADEVALDRLESPLSSPPSSWPPRR